MGKILPIKIRIDTPAVLVELPRIQFVGDVTLCTLASVNPVKLLAPTPFIWVSHVGHYKNAWGITIEILAGI